jgi:hypothetical protein
MLRFTGLGLPGQRHFDVDYCLVQIYLGSTILNVEYGLILVQLRPKGHVLHLKID